MKAEDIDPKKDGVDHINVYSKGKTKLGRALTNFAAIEFKHPTYGHFKSMEGYYYWISTGMIHDELKKLKGFEAKQFGKTLDVVSVDNFEKLITEGIHCKLTQNQGLQEQLINNDLPLLHYYSYGGKVVLASDHDYQIKYIEDFVKLL